MRQQDHAELSTAVRHIVLMEKVSGAIANQVSALRKDGVPDVALMGFIQARKDTKRDVDRAKRLLAKTWKNEPTLKWAGFVHGLGPAIALILGIAPPLTEFATVSKLWKYSGFAPGQKLMGGQKAGFSPLLKAFMTARIADPCIKHRKSPYRADYDARRAHTKLTHPEWTDGHSHNDARRMVAKAVLRDLWLVANGKSAVIDRRGPFDGDAVLRLEPTNRVHPVGRVA